MSENNDPNSKIVKMKLNKPFYDKIGQLAKYLYDFSRKTINPQTGKIEPVLNTPTVEGFIAFATTNYYNLISESLNAEYQKQLALKAQAQQQQPQGG